MFIRRNIRFEKTRGKWNGICQCKKQAECQREAHLHVTGAEGGGLCSVKLSSVSTSLWPVEAGQTAFDNICA